MSQLLCQSCDQPKANLQRVKSSLVSGCELNMCTSCIKLKFEPRFLIILAVRQFGITDEVAKLIKNKRYVGPDIPAADIV